jgi:hypothetical protein
MPDQKMRTEKSMAKTSSNKQHRDAEHRGMDVPDRVVSQVGKAAVQILKLRQSLEENMATAQTEVERQNLADDVETVAVRAISDQGLTVDQYNQVITAAQTDAELEERVLVACRAA